MLEGEGVVMPDPNLRVEGLASMSALATTISVACTITRPSLRVEVQTFLGWLFSTRFVASGFFKDLLKAQDPARDYCLGHDEVLRRPIAGGR